MMAQHICLQTWRPNDSSTRFHFGCFKMACPFNCGMGDWDLGQLLPILMSEQNIGFFYESTAILLLEI